MYRGGRGGPRKSFDGNRTPHRGNYSGRRNWTPYKKPQQDNNTPVKPSPKSDVKPAPTTPKPEENKSATPVPTKVENKNGPSVQNNTKQITTPSPVQKKPDNKPLTESKPQAQNRPQEVQNKPPSQTNPQMQTPTSSKNEPDDTTPAKSEKNGEGSTPQSSNRVRYTGREGEKKFSGRCRLFIANMNNNTTEEELRELFEEFGETGEVFVNKEKGFGFIRLDYRHNAEIAKSTLDKKLFNGRNIQVRFATHASAIELHGLDRFASNEYIEKAMSQFGKVERSIVVCDDRGRNKGYAIVEFEWKKSAQKVLDRFKGEMFVLGRLPKPVFAKPLTQIDEEEGVKEENLERMQGIQMEREFQPRFISPSSYEYTLAKKWRDLYIEEEDKKARLDQELRDARYRLEQEMEGAMQEQEAMKMREELRRRQEELRQFEESILRRQEMARMGREPDRRDYNRRDEQSLQGDLMGDQGQNEYLIQQQGDEMHGGGEGVMLGIHPGDMAGAGGLTGVSLQPNSMFGGIPANGILQGGKPLPPPPAIPGIHMRPPGLPQRDLPPQRGEYGKRARRE